MPVICARRVVLTAGAEVATTICPLAEIRPYQGVPTPSAAVGIDTLAATIVAAGNVNPSRKPHGPNPVL